MQLPFFLSGIILIDTSIRKHWLLASTGCKTRHIQGCKKPPVIGKWSSVKDGFTFDIEYLKGDGERSGSRGNGLMEKIGLVTYQMGVYCLLISTSTKKIKSLPKLTNTSERHIRIWKEIS